MLDILNVAGNNAVLENAHAISGSEAGIGPVAKVRAGADTGVAALGEFDDVVGVPHFVVGFVGARRVVVIADLDVEFLHHGFNGVDGVCAFRINDFDPQLLCKGENFARPFLVLRDGNYPLATA